MATTLRVLDRDRGCTACPLHQDIKSVCIPTRAISQTGKKTALLVISEKPGIDEEKQDAHFVGEMGKLFHNVYIRGTKITDFADVYVTNAVRCKPPRDVKITTKQFKACRKYLDDDLVWLDTIYDKVVLLGAGAGPARALRDTSLDKALHHQGEQVAGHTIFWSYNPAILLPDKDPAKIDAVADHMTLVEDFLEHGRLLLTSTIPEIERAVPYPLGPVTTLTIDIETYGCIKGFPQMTVFQPQRSIHVDKIKKSDLVQTIALTWMDTVSGHMRSSIYVANDPIDKLAFFSFLKAVRDMDSDPKIGKPKRTNLLGMNTAFDIMYLRAWCKRAKFWFDPKEWRLLCLGITNYLHSEIRPERSLKNISPLVGTGSYEGEIDLSKGEQYPHRYSKRLWFYNVMDTVLTYDGYERIKARILRDYPGTNKMSDYCLNWYSDLLWKAVSMSERGIYCDVPDVIDLDKRLHTRAERVIKYATETWDAKLRGKGSPKWCQELVIDAAIECDLNGKYNRTLIRTTIKKEISTCIENVHVLQAKLPHRGLLYKQFQAMELYRALSKRRSTFTTPLLRDHREGRRKVKGGTLIKGLGHPTWYMFPGRYEDDSDGGTKQGRITCKNPTCITWPGIVKRCLSTRYNPGVLLETDLSQIELRTGALLSGDPVMIGEYIKGIDRHLMTGLLIVNELVGYMEDREEEYMFGMFRKDLAKLLLPGVTKKTEGIGVWRQLGKTINFLVLFYGGANKAQQTAVRDVGILLPIEIWKRVIEAFNVMYPVFRGWQKKMIAETLKRGYIEMPLIGQSRMFIGGRPNVLNEIANCPIQTVAADAEISAHTKVENDFAEQELRAMSNLIIYDAMYTECHAEDEDKVREVLTHASINSPYWLDVQESLGRIVPVECETKVWRRTAA